MWHSIGISQKNDKPSSLLFDISEKVGIFFHRKLDFYQKNALISEITS